MMKNRPSRPYGSKLFMMLSHIRGWAQLKLGSFGPLHVPKILGLCSNLLHDFDWIWPCRIFKDFQHLENQSKIKKYPKLYHFRHMLGSNTFTLKLANQTCQLETTIANVLNFNNTCPCQPHVNLNMFPCIIYNFIIWSLKQLNYHVMFHTRLCFKYPCWHCLLMSIRML